MELWDEASGGEGYTNDKDPMVHYTKGRQPGKYPSFQLFRDNVHFVLDLYDPFGLFKNMSEEKKEERLITEINNGRLAMIGIFLLWLPIRLRALFLSSKNMPRNMMETLWFHLKANSLSFHKYYILDV